MRIKTDENNVITTIIYTEYDDSAVEITCDVPADLDVLKYKYIDGQFVVNPDYTPPEPAPAPAVTREQRMSATEDAVAEIIEMLMGGESDG